MLVGDLVYNDNFDCNCNYAIYDATEGKQWADGAKCLFSTIRDGWNKPLDNISLQTRVTIASSLRHQKEKNKNESVLYLSVTNEKIQVIKKRFDIFHYSG